MNKFFRIAFANSGDRTVVPDAVDPSGNVSYTEGYGSDYQLPKTDPDSKNIERDKMNDLFYEVTLALQELQSLGVPDFITSALNGGTAYSYGANALVRYSGDIYQSLTSSNTALPTDATKWALLPTGARVRDGVNVVATTGGTADAVTLALTPAQTAFAPGPTFWRASAANTTTTPTVKRDGLAAKTLVKGNNLPLGAGDIPGAGAWMCSQYDAALDKEVLMNPALGVTPAGSSLVAVRQTVLSGASTSGAADFLAAGTGLAVNLLATATPLVLTTADGFGPSGQIDTVTRITSNVTAAWSGLTSSSLCYLYIDTTSPTVPTYGFSLLLPAYQSSAPSSPATDQHWFDLTEVRMKRWSGSAWVNVKRDFVGECTTGAGTVTSVVSYAFRGEYDSGWTNTLPSAGTFTSRNHNIGVEPTGTVALYIKNITPEANFSAGDIIPPYTFTASSSGGPSQIFNRLYVAFITGINSPGFLITNKTTGAQTTATPANWAYRLIAKRGF